MAQPEDSTSTGPEEQIQDSDLRLALQRGESRRLAVLLIIVLIGGASVLVRHAAGGSPLPGGSVIWIVALLVVVAAYAVLLLTFVRRATERGQVLPFSLWAGTVVVESLFPTAGIVLLLRSGQVAPKEAVVSPAMMMYAVFILLSILRMRPRLCFLGGVLAAALHAGLILHVAAGARASHTPISYPYLLSYPVNLLMTGIAASLVASEVRRYFESSLRERLAQRSLDRMRGELEAARAIQQRLLPTAPPNVNGFDIAGWNRPADRTGGDYYDWLDLPDGRLAVIIADVSGHGLGPALLMAVCRAYIRSCIPIEGGLPAAFRRVNTLLCNDVGDGRFVTLAAVVLDPRTGDAELLSAGHGPIFLHRSRDNRVGVRGANGIPLGIIADEDYGLPVRFTLAHGDTILLVTDGFVEWTRPTDNAQFGAERVAACLRANSASPSRDLIDSLESEISRFAVGSPQSDDMTAVAIRRTADRTP